MNDQESFWTKFWLLIIDKVILGAIIGIVAFFFTWYLQSEHLRADYQKEMFEKRVAAYEAIVASAKTLSDELLAFVAWADNDVGVSAHEILWRKRFGELRDRLNNHSGGGGGGSDTFPLPPHSVLDKFQALEAQRNTNALHFSKVIDAEISTFIDTLWAEFIESEKSQAQTYKDSEKPARLQRIRAAYDRLLEQIQQRLAADKIILG